MVENKDIKKLIGKLFIFGFKGKKMNPYLKELIHGYNINSLILFSHNLGSEDEIIELTSSIQEEAKKASYKKPILISIDQENGLVNRLNGANFHLPGPMALGASLKEEISEEVGSLTAKYLKKLGINWNLAPVLDINTNPNNPGIGIRSFGDNEDLTKKLALSFIEGHRKNKVLTTLKHFPGLGNTSVDPHFGLPKVEKTFEEINKKELVPFKYAIDKGAQSIMTAHLLLPNIDDSNLPATLSETLLKDILRKRLGFNGVILTDCLEMDAISKYYGVGYSAVKSLKSGADLVIVSHTEKLQREALEAVENAILSGDLRMDEIEEKIKRVDLLKDQVEDFDYEYDEEIDLSNLYDYFTKSVTCLKKEKILNKEKRIIALVPENELRFVGENSKKTQKFLKESIENNIDNVEFVEYNKTSLPRKIKEISNIKDNFELIVGLLESNLGKIQEETFKEISSRNNIYTISMRDAYPNGVLFENSKIWVSTFQTSPIPIDIGIKTIIGDIDPQGKLPVQIYFK